jgi:hypothetical protein
MQKQRKPQQQVRLTVVVQASSGVFPGVELAELLEKFARFVRKSTYTGELELQGSFLDMSGGVVWEHEGNADGKGDSTKEG